jgi:hypothetical protein
VLFYGASQSYRELDHLTDQFAQALDGLGVRPGDRVGLMLPNIPQMIIGYYGALKLGAIVMPTNPLYLSEELETQLTDSGAETLIALDLFYARIQPIQSRTSLKRILLTRVSDFFVALANCFLGFLLLLLQCRTRIGDIFAGRGGTHFNGFSKAKARLDRRMLRTLKAMARKRGDEAKPDTRAWREQLATWADEHPVTWEQEDDGPIKPQTAIRAIAERFGPDAIYVAGVGQHQMWTSQLVEFTAPRTWINSGGLGTMGFAVPAAIGAKVGRPDARVVAIDGDGCFQMTLQELGTAVQHDIPVVFCVLNNGSLGMVRQWQELFYDGRFSEVDLPPDLPDLVKLADAYGIPGLRANTVDELGPALDKAFEVTDESVLVDVRVDPTEKVFPMVPAGCGNDEIIESADEWYERQRADAIPDAAQEPEAG